MGISRILTITSAAPLMKDGVQAQGSWIGPYTYRNLNSGKCLEPIPTATRGAPLLQYDCYLGLDNQVWYNTSTYPNVQTNDASHYCMEVQESSLADLTKIVQWDSHRRAHQAWLRYSA